MENHGMEEEANKQKRGSLIVFEGIDRCGKSTQVKLLVKKLTENNIPVSTYCFPNRETAIGKVLDAYLKGNDINTKATHLLFSANRYEMLDTILKDLNEGKNVILDRYAYSGVAYSAAKGLDLRWCMKADCLLPSPDLVIYLALTCEVIERRASFGEERFDNVQFLNMVTINFCSLMSSDKHHHWCTIDGSRSIESIHEEVYDIVTRKTKEEKTKATYFSPHMDYIWDM